MQLAALLLIIASGSALASVNKFYATPYKIIMGLIERNEIAVREISKYIESEKVEKLYDSMMDTAEECVNLFEDRYNKITTENHIPREDFPWHRGDSGKENTGICGKIRNEMNPDDMPIEYLNIIYNCSRLYTNDSLVIYFGEELYDNIDYLKEDIDDAKERLHECANDKFDDIKIVECLTELRAELQEAYNYEIMPFKKELEELPIYLNWTIPECMGDKNPVMKSFWEKIEDVETRHKSCMKSQVRRRK